MLAPPRSPEPSGGEACMAGFPEALKLPASLGAGLHFTPEQFEALCQANPEAVLELAADGSLILMTPTGSETGGRNGSLMVALGLSLRSSGLPLKLFDSSTGLPAQRRPPRLAADSGGAGGGDLGIAGGIWRTAPADRSGHPPGWGAPVSRVGDRAGGDLGGLRPGLRFPLAAQTDCQGRALPSATPSTTSSSCSGVRI
jgi:hypothetical protein